MYQDCVKERIDLLKFLAKIQGAEFKDDSAPAKPSTNSPTQKSSDIPLFCDPEDYKGMSPGEKQKLTDNMMQAHRKWSGGTFTDIATS